VLPGIIAVEGPRYPKSQIPNPKSESPDVLRFCASLPNDGQLDDIPLIVIVDDSNFASFTLQNFLWVTFTRANPAADICGIGAFSEQKHWGCTGSLVIDARLKPHHAPPLVPDPDVSKRIDALAARGGPLAKWL